MTQRKTYTAEFKRDAAGLAHFTENIVGIGRDPGIGVEDNPTRLHYGQDQGREDLGGRASIAKADRSAVYQPSCGCRF